MRLVSTTQDVEDLVRACASSLDIVVDVETSGLQPGAKDAKIFCVGFGTDHGEFVVPASYPGSALSETWGQHVGRALDACRSVGSHNLQFELRWLRSYCLAQKASFDTMLESYLLDENRKHGLKQLAKDLLGDTDDYAISMPADPSKVPLQQLAEYCAKDCAKTLRLHKRNGPLCVQEGVSNIHDRLLVPATKALAEAYYHGVHVDQDSYSREYADCEAQIEQLRLRLDTLVLNGVKVNWNSPQQVARLLFETMGMKPIYYTPKGATSVGETVLVRLAEQSELVRVLLHYREETALARLFKNWQENFCEDGRLRPSFLLHGTVTGRLSSRDPNLQQVPRSSRMRSLITAPPGWVLVEVDHSQVEVRIEAWLSGDPTLLDIFKKDGDVHIAVARDVLGVAEVTPEQRQKAKAVVFGFLFGMQAKKFVRYAKEQYDVDVTLDEAQRFRERFFGMFDELLPWFDRQRHEVRENGYVVSPIGRRRRLPAIYSDDEYERWEAERQAINSPVQSFASDLTLWGFTKLHEAGLNFVQPVGLVHDALLAYVREDRLREGVEAIRETMLDVRGLEQDLGCRVTVPLKVEVKVGPWGKGRKM